VRPDPPAVSPHAPRRPDLHESWLEAVGDVLQSPPLQALRAYLIEEQRQHTTYPPNREIFAALNATPLPSVRVVILGQDPYHGPGQAHGLSFSVRRGVRPPPSLENIFLELQRDVGVPPPTHGDLSAWAARGVLLLNSSLTVRAGQAGSHRGRGWECFTDAVISAVSARREGVAFVLWGRHAQEKRPLVDERRHLVVVSAHPSPYSAAQGFFGSRPFSRVNEHLVRRGEEAIEWSLPD
jgi:uracil-DNA glycosylase